jgi:hypothetical protein
VVQVVQAQLILVLVVMLAAKVVELQVQAVTVAQVL